MSSESSDRLIKIDPRSHLEVADSLHRYAKNLRLYFKEYCRVVGYNAALESSRREVPSSSEHFKAFFKWLDNAENIPELESCPRLVLDNDRVLYLQCEEERRDYKIFINESGLFLKEASGELLSTGSKGWIFVIRDNNVYACEKRTTAYPRFHHSSFFAGCAVQAAGVLATEQGRLVRLLPHSGHYRPDDKQFAWLLNYLRRNKIDLKQVKVDGQRLFKVSRQYDKDGVKVAKTESAHLVNGQTALDFLTVRAFAYRIGLLPDIRNFDRDSRLKSVCSLSREFDAAPLSIAPLPSPSFARPEILEDVLIEQLKANIEENLCVSGQNTDSVTSHLLLAPQPLHPSPLSYLLPSPSSTPTFFIPNEFEMDFMALLSESPSLSAANKHIYKYTGYRDLEQGHVVVRSNSRGNSSLNANRVAHNENETEIGFQSLIPSTSISPAPLVS